MTLIIHRCTVAGCRHPDYSHGNVECSYGHCGAGQHAMTPGPSEYLVTYSPVNGAVVHGVTSPGVLYAEFGRGAIRMCACEECWTLYRSWLGVA